jgi:hypothetical protein
LSLAFGPSLLRLAPCSPPFNDAARRKRGGLRQLLTATARGALLTSGRDGETAPVSRTEKPLQAIDHTNPANSRAIAVTMTGVGLPFVIMRR